MSSEIIRAYAEFTGDWGGVVADSDGSVVAKCFHDAWPRLESSDWRNSSEESKGLSEK